jgi:hypothetical protein
MDATIKNCDIHRHHAIQSLAGEWSSIITKCRNWMIAKLVQGMRQFKFEPSYLPSGRVSFYAPKEHLTVHEKGKPKFTISNN